MSTGDTATIPALPRRLFAALADGAFHSGAELAAREGVTRSAVWKAMAILREHGAWIDAVPNRGYRLAFACEPLDAEALRAALPAAQRGMFESVECAWTLASTNSALLARAPPTAGEYRLLVAEHQSAGRGRLGRRWVGALGGSLLMSVAAGLAELPRDIATLPLVAGLAVRRALRAAGLQGVQLKWPNDIVARVPGRTAGASSLGKLGGVLTELRAEASGPAHVVIGIGLNLQLPDTLQDVIEPGALPPADLHALGGAATARTAIAAAIAAECAQGLRRLLAEGFAPRRDEWNEADALAGQAVIVRGGAASDVSGIARGIDAGGGLLLEVDGALRSIIAGDVSLRAAP